MSTANVKQVIIVWLVCIAGAILLSRHVTDPEAIKPALRRTLSYNQWKLLQRVREGKNKSPTIYAITATYSSYVQKAQLTRISQTLRLVPNVHWIVVEDAGSKSALVRGLLHESNLAATTHLNVKSSKTARWRRDGGAEQINAALKWLRSRPDDRDSGVVYFMDVSYTYSVKVFEEMSKIKKVGVWPVGLVDGLVVQGPVLDRSGKVEGFRSGWMPKRPFAVDRAGFAVNLDLILANEDVFLSVSAERGLQESDFVGRLVTVEELEPLAGGCKDVYVWRTKIKTPVIQGVVVELEV